MSSINSPLGRMRLAQQGQQGQQPRVLSVPDEGGYDEDMFVPRNPYAQGAVPSQLQPNMPQHQHLHPSLQHPQSELDMVKDMRRERVAASSRVNSDARDRLNYLIGIGRKTVDVDVDGTVFTLRTLKSKEMRTALTAAGRFPEQSPQYYHTLRNYTLGYALHSVDGMTLDLVLGDSTPEVVMSYLLEDMDNIVLEFLYLHFLKMHGEQKEKFSIRDEASLKEVAEDVKKS